MIGLTRLAMLAFTLLASTVAAKSHSATIHADSPDMPPLSDLALYSLHNPGKALSAASVASESIACYDKCYGISRSLAVEATNWFCNSFGRMVLKDIDDYYYGTYIYTPSLIAWPDGLTGSHEEGQLLLSITVPADGPNAAEGCLLDTVVPFESCYKNIMYNIDGCNTDRENHKQGGIWRQGCLQYQFQPNPWCEPNCLSDPWYASDAQHHCHSANKRFVDFEELGLVNSTS